MSAVTRSRSKIDEVKAKWSCIDVLHLHGIQATVGKAICCPIHGEKTPSFFVYDAGNKFKCHGCQIHGDAIDLQSKITGRSTAEALASLADGLSLGRIATPSPKVPEPKPVIVDTSLERAARYHKALFSPAGARALDYAKARGLTDKDLLLYDVGFGFAGDELSGRLTFAVYGADGQRLGWTGRALNSDDKMRYRHCRGLQTSKTLFGLQELKPGGGRVAVVEGTIDAIALNRSGVPAVSSFTCRVSVAQARILTGLGFIPVINFDDDEAGKKGAAESSAILTREGVNHAVA
jgi:DNA primase